MLPILILAACGAPQRNKPEPAPATTLAPLDVAWPKAKAPPAPLTPVAPPIQPRSRWVDQAPDLTDIHPMNGVQRITVHHEGFDVFTTDNEADTIERLRFTLRAHRKRGFADIGYHFIVDHAGRIWEGRPIDEQGAHARDRNEHNIGIVMLGNFEKQTPGQPQLVSLARLLDYLIGTYHLSMNDVHTHREMGATECPGRNLQEAVDRMRRRKPGA